MTVINTTSVIEFTDTLNALRTSVEALDSFESIYPEDSEFKSLITLLVSYHKRLFDGFYIDSLCLTRQLLNRGDPLGSDLVVDDTPTHII